MSTVKTTNIQHADAAAVGILLAADGTVGGLRPTQNTQSGTTYSLSLADSGRTVTLSNAAPVTVTLPAQATVAWNAGEMISLLNLGAGTVTVVAAAGVTINGTPLTLVTSKGGSLVRTASNVWTFIPFSGGVESVTINEGSSTNVTFSTLTNPDGDGRNYRLASCGATGTLVVTAPGVAEVLVLNGGSSGRGVSNDSSIGGPGGPSKYFSATTLTVGTLTLTIGAGGAGTTGGATNIGGTTSVSPLSTGMTLAGGIADNGQVGGVSTQLTITGVVFYFGSAGGGGNRGANNGGPNGGGSGESNVNTNNGSAGGANTGGGGGGRWNSSNVAGHNGGSGRILFRYPIS